MQIINNHTIVCIVLLERHVIVCYNIETTIDLRLFIVVGKLYSATFQLPKSDCNVAQQKFAKYHEKSKIYNRTHTIVSHVCRPNFLRAPCGLFEK